MKRYIAIAVFSQFFLCSQSLGKAEKHSDKQTNNQSTSGQTIIFSPADPMVYQQTINALQQVALMQQMQMQQEQQTNKKTSEEAKFVAAAVSTAANLFLCMVTQDPKYIAIMLKEAALVIGRRVKITIEDQEDILDTDSITSETSDSQSEERTAEVTA